ncbi:GTPase [Psychrobacter arenosus]|uniref:GTPase n=1 Tax=Psychrobacter arenosus TaxID=256326 RepID=UPI00191A4676|nr:GTPase [Psychrobacter arenosus]
MNVLEYLGNSYNKDTQSFDAEAARKESYENKPKLNIVLFGATGVGKSALVNAMFGKNIVESGVGKPITQFLEKVEIQSKGLMLWDTKGIEAKDYDNTRNMLVQDIEVGFQNAFDTQDDDQAPHVIWLCIKESSKRIENREYDMLSIAKKFGIPTVIVFTDTQFEEGDSFFETAKRNLDAQYKAIIKNRYVRVNSLPYKKLGMQVPTYGLNELLKLTENCLFEGKSNASQQRMKKYAEALRMAQEVNMKMQLNAIIKSAESKVSALKLVAKAISSLPTPVLATVLNKKLIYMINDDFGINNDEDHIKKLTVEVVEIASLKSNFILTKILFPISMLDNFRAMQTTQCLGSAYISLLTEYYNQETGHCILPRQQAIPLAFFKFNFEEDMKEAQLKKGIFKFL